MQVLEGASLTDVLKKVPDPNINEDKQPLKDYTDDQQKPEDQQTGKAEENSHFMLQQAETSKTQEGAGLS